MDIRLVPIVKPEEMNFILGQAHFIKTVEDLHEAIVTTAPHMKFGLAFCESSGLALVRHSGNDETLVEIAKTNAFAIGAGHAFIIFMSGGFPVNILNAIKAVPEVCHIYCATANPAEVVVGETEQGRAILGVVDGVRSKGIEGPDGIEWRKGFLRKIGYKL
jgi:adenosine/AMP kinase